MPQGVLGKLRSNKKNNEASPELTRHREGLSPIKTTPRRWSLVRFKQGFAELALPGRRRSGSLGGQGACAVLATVEANPSPKASARR